MLLFYYCPMLHFRIEKLMKKSDMLVGNGHHMQYIEAGICVCTITIYMYV